MFTNLSIDDKTIVEVQKIGHFKTKKAAVMSALQEYIARKHQLKIVELFEKIDYDKSYNYKTARKR